MNKELELEAHRYAEEQKDNCSNDYWAFIEGATSEWVEKQKLEFAIEQLKSLGYLHNDDLKTERQRNKIKELEQKLSEL
jgi:hypothetical protein